MYFITCGKIDLIQFHTFFTIKYRKLYSYLSFAQYYIQIKRKITLTCIVVQPREKNSDLVSIAQLIKNNVV